MVEEAIRQTLEDAYGRRVKKSDKYLVAVSGGVDSLVLLHATNKICKVEAAHVNYHLRGAESDADEIHLIQFCTKHGITLHIKDALHEEGNVQGWARSTRFDFFDKLFHDDKSLLGVLLGHHFNDQLESFLMAREAGKSAFQQGGMLHVLGNRVRPFLYLRRSDIEAYAHTEGLTWQEDSSNANPKYARNEMRQRLAGMPPNEILKLEKSFNELHERKRSAQIICHGMYPDVMDSARKGYPVLWSFLAEASDPEMMTPFFYQHVTSGVALGKILEWVKTGKGIGQMEPAGNGVFLFANKEGLSAAPAAPRKSFTFKKTSREALPVHVTSKLKASLVKQAPEQSILQKPQFYGYYINYAKLPDLLTVRPWLPGDRIKLAGGGTKTIGDYFTDDKSHPVYRHYAWVLLAGTDIVFVSSGGYLNADFYASPGQKALHLTISYADDE